MINICNLTKKFGTLIAVNDLSLHVPRGELFCFLGPNGAGKTTTLKIMTGLLRPTSGEVRIADIDILHDPLAAKKLIGYIPDNAFIYDRLTATEFFQFAGELYGIPRERVLSRHEEYFPLFGLFDYRDVLVRDLSHGTRQKLLYASTFLHDPTVLFIDEPLTGLDPHTIRLLKDFFRRRTSEGMTIFITTHILALAEDIADRIGIILNGRLVALGTYRELRTAHGDMRLEDIFIKLTRSAGS